MPIARELLNLSEIGRYLNVSPSERDRSRRTIRRSPRPASEKPRRWSRAKVERWAERHWWDTRPWRKRG
jgi:hypothetical protein